MKGGNHLGRGNPLAGWRQLCVAIGQTAWWRQAWRDGILVHRCHLQCRSTAGSQDAYVSTIRRKRSDMILTLPVYAIPGYRETSPLLSARQWPLTMTGIGCESFDNAIATIPEIKLIAEREFKYGSLEKWTAATYQGFPTFNISNRYFRPAKEGSQHEAIEFSKDVDPVGILQHLGKNNVVHTEDNEVQYFKSLVDDEGKRWYVRET